jgi:hypothetical protein
MQGFPLEGYEPLPPNSPEDTFFGEVVEEENNYDTRSVATPLIEHSKGAIVIFLEGFVSHVNPPLINPLDPLLFRVDSSGNIIPEYYPRLPSRPFQEVNVELEKINTSEGYTTLACTTKMVDPIQTLVLVIWKTPSGHDIFEKISLIRPFYAPPHIPITINVGIETSSDFFGHPVGPTLNSATTSGQISSDTGIFLPIHLQITMMVTPTMPLQETI